MPELPSGTITFLFTDIEGSTRRWERQPEAMAAALARHDDILRRAIESAGGEVFKTVGDAVCAAFPSATSAVEAAVAPRMKVLRRIGSSLVRAVRAPANPPTAR